MTATDLAEARRALAGCRYLLVVPVPWFCAPDGGIWLDTLWHRDLVRHLDYIADLTVLAPRRPLGERRGLVALEPRPGLAFRALPEGRGMAEALLRAPAMLAAAVAAVRRADLVHSGIAGWPLPPGLLVNPVARALRRPLVIVVESAFWRLSGPGPHGRGARLRAGVTERLARWSVRQAALSVFTHAGYRDTLARGARGAVLVTPAAWIDAADLVPDAAAATAARGAPVRLLFAGRLIPEKGVATLIAALAAAEAAGVPVLLDVIGEGPLRADLAGLAARLRRVRLGLREPLPYGPAFFALLRGYHGLVVPSHSDEQPRILVDAAAQAVPALASDTPGHRALVAEGVTGWLHRPGDAAALAAALARATAEPATLAAMGRAARAGAEGRTHQAMHAARAQALAAL
jgi:glycosyltransferase involved in cell wall biosynthesis